MYPSDRTILIIGPVGIAAVLWLLIFAGLVKAEDNPSLKFGTTNKDIAIRNPTAMATINANGDVVIDWPEVERKAAEPAGKFGTERAIAQLMMAIRDGTWKPPVAAPQ